MSNTPSDAAAAAVAALALAEGFTVATAESLTGGQIASTLAAAEDSSDWFAGGVVSYQTRIKYDVLGVPEGQPVITESAVRAMAAGVAQLMSADATLAVSGCGGPGEQEGQPPGTTWIAAQVRGTTRTELHHFPGEPEEILARTRQRSLELLQALMQASASPDPVSDTEEEQP